MKPSLLFPLLVPATVLAAGGWLWLHPDPPPRDDPQAHLPTRADRVSHKAFFDREAFAALGDDPEALAHAITARCLDCHPSAGPEVMGTAHWHWRGDAAKLPGHAEPKTLGKANAINNFCLSAEPNLPRCTSCHAGYGWRDDRFDFKDPKNIDCLVCHEQTGTYVKASAAAGYPADPPAKDGAPVDGAQRVDHLLAIARSVSFSSRDNCGACHFSGGGGDAVKHGDLNGFLYQPDPDVDVHMGGHGLVCTDCHRTKDHDLRGRSMGVSFEPARIVQCTDCHAEQPHAQERLNAHTAAVSCETCHIPTVAKRAATKTWWDWSVAGDPAAEAMARLGITDPTLYNPLKGEFRFATEMTPEYRWYNGYADRVLKGDVIADPSRPLALNPPRGDVRDPTARIHPFKIHRGKQPYDLSHRYLLIPKTYGPDGFWGLTTAGTGTPEARWHTSLIVGAEASDLPYSGAATGAPNFGWVETEMFWPQAHMVAGADHALQCNDCHPTDGAPGRLDWAALGYAGDPAEVGGRRKTGLVREARPFASGEGQP